MALTTTATDNNRPQFDQLPPALDWPGKLRSQITESKQNPPADDVNRQLRTQALAQRHT
jgi:hypothetical protein